jgi:hypothetical protein
MAYSHFREIYVSLQVLVHHSYLWLTESITTHYASLE